MGIEVRGVGTTTLRLNNIANRTSRQLYRLMEQAAQETKKRIEMQTHKDTGALESAIRVRRLSRGGINGRTSFEVFIDPEKRRRVRTRGGGIRRQRVVTYARRLETGEWGKTLGPRSRRKDEQMRGQDPTVRVGTGFMTRSIRFVEAVYRRKIERAIEQSIRR
ncbi:hypothetical protein TW86_03935 [Halomonas sp. S2151]|uniref:hypothetical protein n=1 Tax=Halomonas sp. S2151 TaxID=579478 RepID=UPI0005FA228B|nr:hypothetical protein [Halomonas sp. S2151]KJZ17413.1 hypothetical protein TW86_03935 [Halomonas sp. S2151]